MAVPSWCLVRGGPWRDALLGLTTALPIHRPEALPGDGCLNSYIPVCQIVGGAISPLLLNIALHGMEAALGVRHDSQGISMGKRAVVRYADDFVVFCETEEDALAVKDRILPAWLAERGLSLSPEKTRIVRLTEGFDFLSFNVRHYPHPQTSRSGYKDRKSTRLNSSHIQKSRMPSSA